MLFDCYGTLVDVLTDERDIETYRCLSRWLIYQGGSGSPPEVLRDLYTCRVEEALERIGGEPPPGGAGRGDLCRYLCRTRRLEGRYGPARRRVRPGVPGRIAPAPRRHKEERKAARPLQREEDGGDRLERAAGLLGAGDADARALRPSRLRHLLLRPRLPETGSPDLRCGTRADRAFCPPKSSSSGGTIPRTTSMLPRRLGMQALHVEEAWMRYGGV